MSLTARLVLCALVPALTAGFTPASPSVLAGGMRRQARATPVHGQWVGVITRRQFVGASPLGTAPILAAQAQAKGADEGGSKASSPLGYQDVSVRVAGGVNVPVSVWYPPGRGGGSSDGAASAAKYPHKISVGKIATLLTRGKLNVPSFIGPSTTLSGSAPLLRGAPPPLDTADMPGIIFAHGYLGSRYDMMHICEELASRGFIVAAPELPESLSASYEPNERVNRNCIVEGTVSMLRNNFGVGSSLGIFGHSAGGGTSTSVGSQDFPLGRVAIAGFRGYGGADPLLVIASRGDGIIPLDGIITALPLGCSKYFGGEIEARQALSMAPEKSAAVVFEKGLRGRPLPPNHISFLSEQTNDALVSFLSALLPVARAMEVPVLDFDKYQASRDSKDTAQVVVPLVAGFFEANLGRAVEAQGMSVKD